MKAVIIAMLLVLVGDALSLGIFEFMVEPNEYTRMLAFIGGNLMGAYFAVIYYIIHQHRY